MPLYYLNVFNDDVTRDPEGHNLADDIAANDMATVEARNLASETVKLGHFNPHHYIEITDCERRPIGRVTFGDAVELRHDSPAS